jgi:hypothetical protein
MKKDWTIDIENKNHRDEMHGYQQWVSVNVPFVPYNESRDLWFRGNFKNDNEIGYIEENLGFTCGIGSEGTKVKFYIR